MKKLDKFRKLPAIIFSIGFVLIVIGVSYAFFTYSRTGLYTHEIEGGKMGVIYNETTGNNVTLENAFPLTDEEALTRGVEFEWTVTGFNESPKTIYYAIEMEYGNTIDSKTRFSDTDIKLSLYENNNLIFENEIYDNLNKQDIYYGLFPSGTSADKPTVNNYKIRLWINDNVMITDTTNTVDTTNKHVYSTAEFEKKYASFKINVRANLTDMRVGYLTYDANGGENAPEKTSLTTNKVTTKKPTMAGKGFLGWAVTSNATTPQYKSGDVYSGIARTLYAVWSDTQNVMIAQFPSTITAQRANITEVYFIDDTRESIDEKYNAATIKADLTYKNQGNIKGWLEDDLSNNGKYILYVGSEGTTYLGSSSSFLFGNWTSLKNIDFANIDTSNVINMSDMFYGCSSLINLNLDNFNTSRVKDISSLFSNCTNLSNIDISNFDTNNVTRISSLFYNCKALVNLDLSKLNTSKVTSMVYMFYGCSNLTSLDLSTFNTANVTDMNYMFAFCDKLVSLNLDNFNTSNVTNMNNMFNGCKNLKNVDVINFDTKKVTDMSYMFCSCNVLTNLNVSGFDTSNVTNMKDMFWHCENVVNLDVSNFNTSNVTDMSHMFAYCNSLKSIDVSSFNTNKVTNVSYMFGNCLNLASLSVSNFNTSNVTDMSYMFIRCFKLTEIDVSNFNTSSVTDMRSMFAYCSNLVSLNLSNFDTSSVTDMGSMFGDCRDLISLNLSSFDTSSVTDMERMFAYCSSLTSLNLSNFNTSSVTNMGRMFSDCSSLLNLDLSLFYLSSENTSLTKFGFMFSSVNDNCKVIVKDTEAQSWILTVVNNTHPSSWSTSNVIVKA